MGDVISWVVSHWDLLVEALFAVLAVASVVTRLTKTPKDDQVVRKILGFLSFLRPGDQGGGLKPPLSSATPPDAGLEPRRDDNR